jgi:GntR family transcriptional repressor for pyruvate dehydrogenase complex
MSAKKLIAPKLNDKASLPGMVADYLTGEIERGTFKSGDTLPTEVELAEQFGVSRTVIREALARLKHDGLLQSRQRVGATVAAPYQKRAFRMGRLDPKDPDMLAQLYEVRAILETGAAGLAAIRSTEEDLEGFREYISKLDHAIDKGKHATSFDLGFHHHLGEASHNPLLEELMGFFNTKISQLIQMAREKSDKKPELAKAVQHEHVEMYEAIESGDAEKAMKRALEHLRSGARRQDLAIFDDKKKT